MMRTIRQPPWFFSFQRLCTDGREFQLNRLARDFFEGDGGYGDFMAEFIVIHYGLIAIEF